MNTQETYERRLDRSIPEPTADRDLAWTSDALAVRRDPSVPVTAPAPDADRSAPGLAWVRPSAMPTLLGSRVAGRGIDLQTELTRRARRTPGAVLSNASRRLTRTSSAQHDPAFPSTTDHEGRWL